MLKFFKNPFATSGDKVAVPDTVTDGTVAYTTGYPITYQTPIASGGKAIERTKLNQVLFDITNEVSNIQQHGYPDYITSALNGGAAYSYAINSVVRWTDGLNYINIVANNTNAPNVSGWVPFLGTAQADSSNAFLSNSGIQKVGYFSGAQTGLISLKIAGLVTATSVTTDLGFMKVIITQDDRDLSSVTNPTTWEILIKANMASGHWYNAQAICEATSGTTSINVRFTRTATDAYIEIGDIGTVWNYATVDVYHVASYIISGYSPIISATLQNSILGTVATDSLISVIPSSTKNENTLQSNIASATTTTIGTYLSGDTLHVTGNTTITSLGVSTSGTIRNVIFDGVLILTHNATSLNLPTSANITTAVGDAAMFVCTNGASGYWTCLDYQRKDGSPVSLSSLALVNPTANNITYKSTPVTVTAWAFSGTTTTTITLTVASHTFVVNDFISVNGLTTSTAVSTANNYIIPNGIYQVTAITSTTIQYTITTPSALTLTPTVSSATVIGQTAVNGAVGGLGSGGQTWQIMTSNRVAGTTYYNTSGKPIFPSISVHSSAGNSTAAAVGFTIDGTVRSYLSFFSNGDYETSSLPVPNGSSYSFSVTSNNFIYAWSELR